jgi:hypothetical protein
MLRRVPRSLRGRVTMIECSLGQMVCSSSYVFCHILKFISVKRGEAKRMLKRVA